MKNIADVGEFGFIDIIKKKGNPIDNITGIGDDCAIIPMGDREIVVSIDTLTKGVHFFENINPYYLGRKALSVNISDVAAMAAIPKWAFLSVSLEKTESLEYMEEFLKGFYDVAEEFNVSLLGGDTTKSDVFSITVTIIGENKIGQSIKRSGAKVGDYVYVSGKIGCSYAGFVALKNNFDGYEELKLKHINPTPRVKEALSIKKYATAMIDVSDGLLQDLNHICKQSGVSAVIDFDSIPLCDTNLVKKEDMLIGGEDYEIVFCADNKYDDIISSINNITRIGIITDGLGVKVVKNGKKLNIDINGYKHF